MKRIVALVGNPNVGKTSLFNTLTKTYQKVGNWTGVTVDIAKGKLYKNDDIEIVDLPGLYSINGGGVDEKKVISFLQNNHVDLIVNVIDSLNIFRNLNLTNFLLKLKIPLIIALNFADELKKNNIRIDKKKLRDEIGAPILEISAKKNFGINELKKYILTYNDKPTKLEIDLDRAKSSIKAFETKEQSITKKIDNYVLGRFTGFIILFLVIFIIYFLSLKLGGKVGDKICEFFSSLESNLNNSLNKINCPKILTSFLAIALIRGVGEVLSFLSQVLILFFLLTLLEECGYYSRVAFLLDKLFNIVGLSGKSAFSLILSLGCTVSGIISTRTIENERERENTIFLIPFMPCSAKMVVIAWLSKIFFNDSPLIATLLFFIGLFCIVIVGRIMKRSEKGFFLLEMPIYRIPNMKNVFEVLREKFLDFTFKAGSVIFIVSVIYWFLLYFGVKGFNDGNIENSFLFIIGNILKYIFYPLGFKNWQITTSLISGLLARESIIETFLISNANINTIFSNGFSVFAFLTFILLSPPCFASLNQARLELGGYKKLLKMILLEFVVAYTVSLSIVLLGKIFYLKHLYFFILIGIIFISQIILLKRRKLWKAKQSMTI